MRAAVRAILVEEGYQATTIPKVARRAGIGAPTIYRRWPTKAALVESVFEGHEPDERPALESLDAVVRYLVAGSFRIFGDPATRRAVPGLLVEYQHDGSRYGELVARLEAPERDRFRAVHAAAVASGEAASSPTPDDLFDVMVATTLFLAVVRGECDDQAIDRVVGVVLAAASPKAGREG